MLPLSEDGTLMLQDASSDIGGPDASLDWENTDGATFSPTAPANPTPGDKWVNNTDPSNQILKIWNGHFWAGNAIDAASVFKSPKKDLYVSYLNGDGRPPNGAPYTFGIAFPEAPAEGQFHLRTDYMPNRLFRFNGKHWMKFEDNVRMTMTNSYDENAGNPDITKPQDVKNTRKTQRTGFINNNNTATIAGKVVQERQALSKVLKPKADN